MRRYALDVTLMLGRRTGIGRVVEELVFRVAQRLDADETLTLVTRTFRLNPLFGTSHAPLRRAAGRRGVRVVRVPLPSSAIVSTPIELFAGPLDVVHGPNNALPATRAARGVATIHDLGPMRHAEHVPPKFAAEFRRGVEDAARRADRIVAPSEFTKREVVELLGVPPERIEVVPLGVADAFFAPADAAADRRMLAERHGVEGPFVLFVGTTNPRKNLPRLVQAFQRVRATTKLPHRLVVVGDRGFEAPPGGDGVRWIGYVDEADLPAFYRAADVVALPSLYEGFGLPVVEAMAAGAPVLTSSTTALAETAGDAALLVDPESVDDVAAGLARLLTDVDLRARLVAAGRRRAAEFSNWERPAARHLALWRELAAAPRR